MFSCFSVDRITGKVTSNEQTPTEDEVKKQALMLVKNT